jgi:hypothetical protein
MLILPQAAQAEPTNLVALKTDIALRWPMTSLLDVLKETDIRVGFTNAFQSPILYTASIWTEPNCNTEFCFVLYWCIQEAGGRIGHEYLGLQGNLISGEFSLQKPMVTE